MQWVRVDPSGGTTVGVRQQLHITGTNATETGGKKIIFYLLPRTIHFSFIVLVARYNAFPPPSHSGLNLDDYHRKHRSGRTHIETGIDRFRALRTMH